MVVAGNIVGSFVCQTNVGNKSCFACNNEREKEREGEGRRGELLPSKLPFEYHRKYRTSFSRVSFRGQKSSRIRYGDDLYFQVAPTCNNYIYIYMSSSVDTFSSTSQTRSILVNFGRVAVAFVCTAFQTCLFDFTFTAFFSIFNPIFLFLSLESRNEVILREPTRKLPNFRSFSFIFSLEITRPAMFMRGYKSSRSLVISVPSLPWHSLRFPVQ